MPWVEAQMIEVFGYPLVLILGQLLLGLINGSLPGGVPIISPPCGT